MTVTMIMTTTMTKINNENNDEKVQTDIRKREKMTRLRHYMELSEEGKHLVERYRNGQCTNDLSSFRHQEEYFTIYS